MSQLFIRRPQVEALVFRLYDRPIHPEFIETLTTRRVHRLEYNLSVRITPSGHCLEWTSEHGTLTELMSEAEGSLPEAGRKIQLRFEGERRGRWQLGSNIQYQVSVQSENVSPEVFLHLHEELANDGAKRGLLFHFRPTFRLGLAPLGFVTAEQLPSGLSISSFHTFPDEFAIVKTQSLIEMTPQPANG